MNQGKEKRRKKGKETKQEKRKVMNEYRRRDKGKCGVTKGREEGADCWLLSVKTHDRCQLYLPEERNR